MSEAALYPEILKAASRDGHRLFRNHVGLSRHRGEDGEERAVRHGLPPGSSDLIGWTADGKFAAIEVKAPGWKPTPGYLKSKAGMRQVAFIEAVRKAGGRAGFATSVTDAVQILNG